jgi:hypothetical protein
VIRCRIYTGKLKQIAAIALLSLACGPAKPVLLYVPPSVTIDPFGSARRTAEVVSSSRNFWEAMSNLDTGYVSRHPVSGAQAEFAKGIGLIMSGRHEEAELSLDGLRSTADDSLIIRASRILVTAMLQYEGKWQLLAELDSLGRRIGTSDLILDKAGVESWATAFRRVPEREISYSPKPSVLPLALSESGAPMIKVSINGRQHFFWLDTGSSMSIVSGTVAEECGIQALVPDTLEVVTTTGRVPAQAGSIASLELGGIKISNSTALIVSDERMQVQIGDDTGMPYAVQIEGVIGYDIISRLDVRLDYANLRATLAKPEVNAKLPRTGRNLFWVGTPIVRLVTSKGVPLHFNLDTGAQETYSTDELVLKTKSKTFAGERRLVGGLAGVTTVHGRFVDQVKATMSGQPLVLRRMLVFAPAVSSFVSLDGILGGDIGRGGVVRIDATNGIFQLSPSR